MSRGKNLQEMEVGTKQSKTAVNAGAKAAEAMPTMSDPGTQLGSVEDLGGPTPKLQARRRFIQDCQQRRNSQG